MNKFEQVPYDHMGPPHPVDRQTDTTENIIVHRKLLRIRVKILALEAEAELSL